MPWPKAAPQPLLAKRRTAQVWLLPGVLAMLALVLTSALPGIQAWLARRAVESLVTQQEQARLAGDWAGLRATFQDPAGDWAATQAQHLQAGWQAAAFGLPAAHPDSQHGQIIDYQLLTPRLARVDVARAFLLADGTRAQFAQSQFYEFSARAWRQVPPPSAPAGDLAALHGARVDVHYNPGDADLAARVGGDLDALLARACSDWDCPADLRVAVVFGSPDPAPETNAAPMGPLAGSLILQMLVAGQPQLPGLVVSLPTRDWAGYPADSPALAAVLRAVAVQALANIGERLSGGAPAVAGPIRPLRYAMVVRELARLGVEPAALLTLDLAQLASEPNRLWPAPADDTAAWQELPAALSLVDGLLDGRPLTDERRLLRWLGPAPDPTSWVADGLELTPEQACAHLMQP